VWVETGGTDGPPVSVISEVGVDVETKLGDLEGLELHGGDMLTSQSMTSWCLSLQL
jgi:hypothetical protein